MQKKWGVIFILLFIFADSCKTDFSIIAPYKQITVVYGLLDPAASVNYIKVNKAFLGEGNALVMAKQADSTNYAPGVLNVSIQNYDNGGLNPAIQLDTTTTIPKDSGLFSYPYQLLYETPPNTTLAQDGSVYNLSIYNNSDKQLLTSTTSIVGLLPDMNITHPGPNEPINFTGIAGSEYNVIFLAPQNARLFSLLIQFNYIEINTVKKDTTAKYINWDQGTQTATNLNTMQAIEFVFNRTDFYGFVESQLTVSPSLKRMLPPQPIVFIITWAGDELNTYISVNEPSIGIVQQVPTYTNIINGIGIFSSRSSRNLPRNMDAASVDTLQVGQVTANLNFQ